MKVYIKFPIWHFKFWEGRVEVKTRVLPKRNSMWITTNTLLTECGKLNAMFERVVNVTSDIFLLQNIYQIYSLCTLPKGIIEVRYVSQAVNDLPPTLPTWMHSAGFWPRDLACPILLLPSSNSPNKVIKESRGLIRHKQLADYKHCIAMYPHKSVRIVLKKQTIEADYHTLIKQTST